ncbi:MAG: hypothetical protein ACRDOO_21260, partial [Actinomadura sp.]
FGYAGLVALVTWQALRGRPLVHPDSWTLGALAALIAAVALAAYRSLGGVGAADEQGGGVAPVHRGRDAAGEAPPDHLWL